MQIARHKEENVKRVLLLEFPLYGTVKDPRKKKQRRNR